MGLSLELDDLITTCRSKRRDHVKKLSQCNKNPACGGAYQYFAEGLISCILPREACFQQVKSCMVFSQFLEDFLALVVYID